MRRPALLVAPALLALHALAALVPAASAATYSQLRADHPIVGATVASAPGGGLDQRLRRVSDLLADPTVAALPPGSSASLDKWWIQKVDASLRQLEHDLERALPRMDLEQRLVLAQVVDEVAVERLVELHLDQPWRECDAANPCSNARLLVATDRITDLLAASVREAVAEWRAANGSAPGPEATPTTVATFSAWVDAVVGDLALATGIESIDG